MRLDPRIVDLWRETEGSPEQRAEQLLNRLQGGTVDDATVERLRSLIDTKDYRGLAALIESGATARVGERHDAERLGKRSGGRFSSVQPATVTSSSAVSLASLSPEVKAAAAAVLADHAGDDFVAENARKALRGQFFDASHPAYASISDDQRVFILNSLRSQDDPMRTSAPPPPLPYDNASAAVAGLDAARFVLQGIGLKTRGHDIEVPLDRYAALKCLIDNVQGDETAVRMAANLARSDIPTILRVRDATESYSSMFDRHGASVFGAGAGDHAYVIRSAAHKALPVEKLQEMARAYADAGRFDRASKLYRLLSAVEVRGAREKEQQCTVLHGLQRGSWNVAAAELAALGARAKDAGYSKLKAELPAGEGGRLSISQRAWESLNAKEYEVLRSGLRQLGQTTAAGLEYEVPESTIDFRDLIAAGRARIPAELRAAIGDLRDIRQRIKAGPKPPSVRHKAVEKEVGSRADRLMAEFRRELLEGSRLARSEAETLAVGVNLSSNARNFYGRERLRAGLSELLLLANGSGLGALQDVVAESKRAYAKRAARVIDLGDQKIESNAIRRALFHEYGHHLEFVNPDLRRAMDSWRASRATSDEPVPLDNLLPGVGYGAHEIAYPDDFVTPYVGRAYKDGHTEVLATGVERFRNAPSMTDFMAADEEHFALVLGALER